MNAPAVTGAREVGLDPENPWLGLLSYAEESRAYFHGRDAETAELSRRVQHGILTVLCGQSGLGKTSLLRAGVVPRLRGAGYCPVYVRLDYSPDSPAPAEQLKQAVFRATATVGRWTRPGVSVAAESLWEFLHHRGDLLQDAAGRKLMPLLIFDQFEEIFTLGQADDAGRTRAKLFLTDLADLVENRAPTALEARLDDDDSGVEDFDFTRADYRVLITLREDYLAQLESLKADMPSVTQNRMRLARMTGDQALNAVRKPGGRLVSPEVAEAIVRFVAGVPDLANAEVEPSLLSLVCRELNSLRQARHHPAISTDLLAGSRATILSEFYERALGDQPDGVRRVIEDDLLTESGYRESVAEERVVKALAAVGAAPDALATLVNRRLLRIEERLDVRRVELTHDVLCGVVIASRNVRREREARERAERELAAQQTREVATRRALRRAYLVASACALLLVVAIAGAVFGYFGMRQARRAERQALQARTNAEKLVGNLTSGFYDKIAPTGQTATLASLAQTVVDYYSRLPSNQRTPQTELNRATSLLLLGESENDGGRYAEASKALREAQSVFERLRADGDQTDTTTFGLARSLYFQAAPSAVNGNAEDQRWLQQAAELLRPLVETAQAPRRYRQTYAEVLDLLSFSQPPEQAAASEDTARRVLAGLGASDLSDLTAAVDYASTSDSEARNLLVQGRIGEALPIQQRANELLEQVLQQRPGELRALRTRVTVLEGLSEISERMHDTNGAMRYAMSQAEAAKDYLRFDPSNEHAWHGRTKALAQVAHLLYEGGGVPGALAVLEQVATFAHSRGAPPHFATRMGINTPVALLREQALLLAQSGDAGGAAKAAREYALASGHGEFRRGVSTSGTKSRLVQPDQSSLDAGIDLAEGRAQAAFDAASAAARTLQAMRVKAGDINATGHRVSALDGALAIASAAALRLRRYADAATLARERLAALAAWPPGSDAEATVGGYSFRPQAEARRADVVLAHALAAQGQGESANSALQPALADYVGEDKAGAQGTTFRHDYAYALYVAALATPATAAGRKQRATNLDAAAKQLNGASSQARALSSLRHMADLIAAARTTPKA